jgi:hypothetical protein
MGRIRLSSFETHRSYMVHYLRALAGSFISPVFVTLVCLSFFLMAVSALVIYVVEAAQGEEAPR